MEKPQEDAISTQIEGLDDKKSNSSLFRVSNDDDLKQETFTKSSVGGKNNDVLDKHLVDALQNITKEQVRQILEPIFETLGAALDPQVGFLIQTIYACFLSI